MFQFQSWEWVPQAQETEEARVWRKVEELRTAGEKAGKVCWGRPWRVFRAVAGVWLLLFVSGQLLEVSSRVRGTI